MKSVIIIVATMALACAVASVEARSEPVDVCRDGTTIWVEECKLCGGRPDCMKCINDVFYSSRKLSVARDCKSCLNTANPGPCYQCIPNIPLGSDTARVLQECLRCADQQEIGLAERCSQCLGSASTLSHAYRCKECRSSSCFRCLKFSSSADKCKP